MTVRMTKDLDVSHSLTRQPPSRSSAHACSLRLDDETRPRLMGRFAPYSRTSLRLFTGFSSKLNACAAQYARREISLGGGSISDLACQWWH